MKKSNIIFVFGDQWRQQATGYTGNTVVRTPNLDKLSKESINFENAVSGCAVCSPYRASLMSGQRPLTHGVFINDVHLEHNFVSIAEAFSGAGYNTAYIGKWHIDGNGRSAYIPKERHLGFEYWKVLECTHDYNNSFYYTGDSDEKHTWDGYDAIAQTKDAEEYIKKHAKDDEPFMMVLSWGPPHNPYETAPEEYRALYRADDIELRPNVPKELESDAREWLRGYYAHCSALDACIGNLQQTIKESGIEEDTIFVFTSDHGDLLGSHGEKRKQQPWEESIRVPFLLKHPQLGPKELKAPIDAPDIMPTLLGLCDIPIPDTVEGIDYSSYIKGDAEDPSDGTAYLQIPHPFGEWSRCNNGKEYRGIRTEQYTYVIDLKGPWLLFDNINDPYQMNNLINNESPTPLQREMDKLLHQKMDEYNDEFLYGMDYVNQWGYKVDEKTQTVKYKN